MPVGLSIKNVVGSPGWTTLEPTWLLLFKNFMKKAQKWA